MNLYEGIKKNTKNKVNSDEVKSYILNNFNTWKLRDSTACFEIFDFEKEVRVNIVTKTSGVSMAELKKVAEYLNDLNIVVFENFKRCGNRGAGINGRCDGRDIFGRTSYSVLVYVPSHPFYYSGAIR